MDLVILLVLIVLVIMLYRDIKFLTYLFAILEVFFKVAHYIGDNISFIRINRFVNNYIPESLFSIFKSYTTGIVYDVISWSLIVCFCAFIYFIAQYMIRRK